MGDQHTRFVSIRDFSLRAGLSRATVYNLIERGEIAAPKKLTARRVGFPSDVVDQWFASKMTGAA